MSPPQHRTRSPRDEGDEDDDPQVAQLGPCRAAYLRLEDCLGEGGEGMLSI
jgi:hypothetical protein